MSDPVTFPTDAEFRALPPKSQGYLCYMRGVWPGAPEFLKACPYAAGTPEHEQFGQGEFAAILDCQETEG